MTPKEKAEELINNVMARARSFDWSDNLVYMGGVALNCLANRNLGKHFNNICGQRNLNRVNIWRNIKQWYGEEVATQIFPKTYILPDEIDNLLKDPNKQFILKKTWGSYRKGCKLFDNKDEMKKNHKKLLII